MFQSSHGNRDCVFLVTFTVAMLDRQSFSGTGLLAGQYRVEGRVDGCLMTYGNSTDRGKSAFMLTILFENKIGCAFVLGVASLATSIK